MKKRILWAIALALLVFLGSCALAEGKREGNPYPSYREGIYLTNYASDPRLYEPEDLVFPAEFAINVDDSWEELTGWQISFVSGDEQVRDAFRFDDDTPLLRNTLWDQPVEGEGIFLVELESENSFCSYELNASFVDFSKVPLSQKKVTLTIPLNETQYLDALLYESDVFELPDYPLHRYLWARAWRETSTSIEYDYSTEGYEASSAGYITGNKPGEYPLQVELEIGRNQLPALFDLTVRVMTEEETAVWVEAIEEERSGGVFSTAAGEFTGNETVNAEMTWEKFLWPWLYIPSTLPEGFEESVIYSYVKICPPGKNGSEVDPDRYSIEWISGDERLKNALVMYEGTNALGEQFMELRVKQSVRRNPGEAVFRIRLGAGNLYWEKEYTLRILSWEEYPLFEFRNPDRSATVKKYNDGGKEYTVEQLENLLILDRAEEIGTKILPADELEQLKDYLFRINVEPIDRDEDELERVDVLIESGPNGKPYMDWAYRFLREGRHRWHLSDGLFHVTAPVTLNAEE